MNKKQEKVLARLDYLELVLSTVGFITSCLVFALTRMNERYFFYLVAVILGFNIIHNIKILEKKNEKRKIIKYSKKLIDAKNLKKVSY